ncbi:hypothetical protein AAC03nite_07550 [Alicyclobacillus acidoterrestris]|uniref:hypothetical protein n=1 Tax=Alicyclobacillus suci TaxID=2816080 RepID=UPI001197403D|nr:hypothetical protein [Alicyclobacillus suci]GEO24970.1 hypothetical protein AAC03nite_07550 [Alicyclobacillus acidoterrestris]
MPSMFNIGILNVSTPQQNAGVFLGELNFTGWDANMKMNQGQGGIFGVLCMNGGVINSTFDGLEGADGNILDQDMKGQISGNV